jgi:hypothetical protein
MRENRTSGSEGREKGNQPFFLTSINRNNGWKPLLQDFGDGATPLVDEELGTPRLVLQVSLLYVDAEVVVEGGEHLLRVHRTFGRLAAQAIGGADDLPGAHAAAG